MRSECVTPTLLPNIVSWRVVVLVTACGKFGHSARVKGYVPFALSQVMVARLADKTMSRKVLL